MESKLYRIKERKKKSQTILEYFFLFMICAGLTMFISSRIFENVRSRDDEFVNRAALRLGIRIINNTGNLTP